MLCVMLCYVIKHHPYTNLKSNTNPNPNPNANPINVHNIHKNERHNERHNAPPVEWNVEIRLFFSPVFVAHGLKVRLPVFVATSYTILRVRGRSRQCVRFVVYTDPVHVGAVRQNIHHATLALLLTWMQIIKGHTVKFFNELCEAPLA